MFPDFLGAGAAIPTGERFDVDRILASLRAIVLPAPSDLLPTWTGQLGAINPAVAEAKRSRLGQQFFGGLAVAGAVLGFAYRRPRLVRGCRSVR
jgi:hypothetical protein